MIRATTLFWLVAAGAVGGGLFHVKHRVQALEEERQQLQRAILAEQQATHVLRAEWSYINRPARLQELAGRHLDLAPIGVKQFGRVADLPIHGDPLPAPAAAAPRKPASMPAAAH